MGKTILLALMIIGMGITAKGTVRLPVLVSDGMVLQRDRDIVLWGSAEAGEKVTAVLNRKSFATEADAQGKWTVTLPQMKAGGPYTIRINDLEIKDVLIGDVWLCSGQSNMELPVSRVLDLYREEVAHYSNPMIRYIKIPLAYNFNKPQEDIRAASWLRLTPENAPGFSALCYFYAKRLNAEYNVPIGIINSAVGGSPVEAWISEDGLKTFPQHLNQAYLYRSDKLVESIKQSDNEQSARWTEVMNSGDEGLREKWFAKDCDDSAWQETDLLDDSWGRDEAGGAVNGSYWFRKKVELSEIHEGKKAVLRLGCIVNGDSVFVNGVFVGAVSYQYPPRIYRIPENLLHKGANTIAIRLFSYGGLPQFVPDKPYKLIIDGRDEIDLRGKWRYRSGVRMPAAQGGTTFQYVPTGLYNSMIAPLLNLRLKGVLWYQGESNTGRHTEYYELLSILIREWRERFGCGDIPFLIAQLPNFMEVSTVPQESQWAYLREAQLKVSQTVANTGLAVAIDLGEWNDIHPLNKKDVAERLALLAGRMAYGNNKTVCEGPVYKSFEVSGNRMILSFKEGTDDLPEAEQPGGFAIAGKDNVFKRANAIIRDRQVIVWHDEVPEPIKVRYAWADNPAEASLRNKSGLPASPFQLTIDN
ncbi:MAG: sialate O-acetylesterase [Tannerella sp.]|nr:sialate O-acetylesterase [Tannerella sp.]